MSDTPAISVLLAAGLAAATLEAGTEPRAGEREPATDTAAESWNWSAAAGLAYADGNAQSVAYQIRVLAARKTARHESEFGAGYFQARDGGVETTNTLRVHGRHRTNFTERAFLGLTGEYRFDKVADLDHRVDFAATPGFRAIEDERSSLSFEAGPGYTWERQGGATDHYPTLRVAQHFEYRLGPNSKFTQSLAYTPEIGDFGNSVWVAEAGLAFRVTDHWALRTAVRHQIDRTPAAGRGRRDTTVLSGVTYSLGGAPEEVGSKSPDTLLPTVEERLVAPMGWVTEAALGYSLSAGNAEQSSLRATVDSARRSQTDELFLDLGLFYATADGATSVDTLEAGGRYQRLAGERAFFGGGLDFRRDALADLEYRITPGLYAGRYLVESDDATLSLEAGLGYTFEKRGGVADDFATVQAAQRYRQSLFGGRATLRQEFVARTEIGDPENYTLQGSVGLDTRVNDRLAWRNELIWQHDHNPTAGREREDTTLTSGVAVRF